MGRVEFFHQKNTGRKIVEANVQSFKGKCLFTKVYYGDVLLSVALPGLPWI